jgi:hypothetical protein
VSQRGVPALFRERRRGGETVRRLIACLIAAVAIRSGAAVLHADADFDVLARHTKLQLDEAADGPAPRSSHSLPAHEDVVALVVVDALPVG